MTTPHGHPDYQGFASTISPNLFPAFSQNLAPGTYETGIIPVASWSSVLLNTTVHSGFGKVSLQHYGDLAGTNVVGTDTWPAFPTTALTVRSPLRGLFFQIQIQVTSGVNMVIDSYAALMSAPADRISFPVGNQRVGTQGKTVAAGASDRYPVSRIASGRGWLLIVDQTNSGKLSPLILATDETGATTDVVAQFPAPSPFLNTILELPDLPLVLQITNTDGVAGHPYNASFGISAQ